MELFSGWPALLFLVTLPILSLPQTGGAWTIQDYNPWKQLRESRIFSLTRSNPIGSRILVIPVLDEPVNTPVYTRVCTEFTNQLRSFSDEVWLITDLPEGPVKQGFYAGLSRILADYRLKNQLSMDLISTMIPDFECDFIALFEVTSYDRYWIDHDLQHRVGLRCVLYDYQDGGPRVEKYFQGGRGRRLEEGAFSEAERIAVKGLVGELERPLRRAVEEREKELQRQYNEIGQLAALTNQQEWAIHKYDLGVMEGRMAADREKAMMAERSKVQIEQERDYWKQQAEAHKKAAEQYQSQINQAGQASTPNIATPRGRPFFPNYRNRFTPRFQFPCPPVTPRTQSSAPPVQNLQAPPTAAPPRMPTLQPIDYRGTAPDAGSPSEYKASPVIAFKGFQEAADDTLQEGPLENPPWESEPAGEWEYVGN